MLDKVWDGILDVLSTVAPGIATCLGGPLAGAAVGAIVHALNLPEGTSADEIVSLVQKAAPETLAALKAAEQKFQSDMKALDIDLERVNAGDRADARKRQVELKDHAPAIMGGGVLLLWACVQGYIVVNGLPPNLPEVVITGILRMIDAAAMGVIFYYFGSSNQNKPKS